MYHQPIERSHPHLTTELNLVVEQLQFVQEVLHGDERFEENTRAFLHFLHGDGVLGLQYTARRGTAQVITDNWLCRSVSLFVR